MLGPSVSCEPELARKLYDTRMICFTPKKIIKDEIYTRLKCYLISENNAGNKVLVSKDHISPLSK